MNSDFPEVRKVGTKEASEESETESNNGSADMAHRDKVARALSFILANFLFPFPFPSRFLLKSIAFSVCSARWRTLKPENKLTFLVLLIMWMVCSPQCMSVSHKLV